MTTKRTLIILVNKGDEAFDYDTSFSNERLALRKALDLSLSHHTETRVVESWGFEEETVLGRFFQGCSVAI